MKYGLTKIANRYGLKSGDYIKLKNQDGVVSNKIKVKATERIRTDCVYMVHGFGHNAKKTNTCITAKEQAMHS